MDPSATEATKRYWTECGTRCPLGFDFFRYVQQQRSDVN